MSEPVKIFLDFYIEELFDHPEVTCPFETKGNTSILLPWQGPILPVHTPIYIVKWDAVVDGLSAFSSGVVQMHCKLPDYQHTALYDSPERLRKFYDDLLKEGWVSYKAHV